MRDRRTAAQRWHDRIVENAQYVVQEFQREELEAAEWAIIDYRKQLLP